VNTFTTSSQRDPSVAGVGSAGDFVVAWRSTNQDGDFFGVFGQRFGSDGTPQGAEFQVNTFTTNNQGEPSVAGLGSAGDFVVAWRSTNQDGDSFGVFGQRFAGPVSGTVTVTAPTSTKEAFGVGSIQRIRAEHDQGSSATFDVEISRDAGSSFSESLATGVASAANGTAMNFNWTVTDGSLATPQTAVVRVIRNGAPSISNVSGQVVISAPSIDIKRPRNNVKVSPFKIVWLHNLGYRRPFEIALARDGTNFTETIAASTLSQWAWRGEFNWPASGSCSPQCVMRVTSLDQGSVFFDDSVTFDIVP
jgi:hypothetical protein